MFDEGDDRKLREKLRRAEDDQTLSANEKYKLKKEVEQREKQKLVTLQKELTKKNHAEKLKKQKEEMNKKGILSQDQKDTSKKMIDAAKRQADAARAQGQTENPLKSV